LFERGKETPDLIIIKKGTEFKRQIVEESVKGDGIATNVTVS